MSMPNEYVQDSEFAAGLADLQVEISCPMCKEYFQNPVTLKCGHNFCLSCVSMFWKDLKGRSPCPSCWFNCPERQFSSNHLLSNLTEIVKLFPIRPKRRREEGKLIRTRRKQALTSLPQRDFSTNPKHHFIWPIEKAAQCHRKQIDRYIELWRERVEPVEKTIAMQKRKLKELKRKVKRRREEINSEYEQVRVFLQDQQETILKQLQDEEVDVLAKLNENLTKISDYTSSLKHLLKEAESKCEKSHLDLLACAKDIYHRQKSLQCPEPGSFTLKEYGYRLPPQYYGLFRIIERFKVDVTLDPETAHCKLTVSEDRRAVQYGNKPKLRHSQRFYFCPAVLGSKGYRFDRQYWEVEVGDKPEWVLGVCKEPLPRRRSQQTLIQDGLWGVGLYNQMNYVAVGPKKINLLPKVTPSKIGIFLDSEVGEVSFYNLNDNSLLYSFSDCPMGPFWPYFCTGTDPKPLKICTITNPGG
ncbi:tripartite motif-containing protein 60-like [Nannospalax galili]|uniref:tripartite motif-containing protein 60-like n=1 Tax=Nannospalax galili TaxID=1026970 RepID=UPI000819F72C|nr:tripartite motif-containing protein 60-like [Nannospalax galili]